MASIMNTAEGSAQSYLLDAAKSRFLVRATATGLLSAFGHSPAIAIRNFTGEAWFRPQSPEQSSLRLEIEADSLAVAGDVKEKDRYEMGREMKETVLETARFPQITFESSGIQANRVAEGMFRLKIGGRLNLHGVERDLEIPCTVTASDDSLRANGDFSIRQSDYRIRPVSAAGGAIKLKDELKFTFDIVGNRRKD
jgi:polyisoprenoid-binding protein YceI